MRQDNYHRIPVSRGNTKVGRQILDMMMTIGWSFYGIEYNRDKKVNEYLFKQKQR